MARMWTCGFELQSTSAEFGVNSGAIVTGAPSISTSVHRVGTASLRINSSAATQFIEHQITTGVVMRTLHRLYLRIATLPDTATNIYGIGQNNYFPGLLRLQTDGTLVLRDGFTETTLTGTSAALTTGRWYRVELDYTDVSGALTSGVSAFKGYLDGVQFSNAMCSNINGFSRIRMGVQLAATTDFYMDDVAINDTTGSAQTGLPGPGSVVHLRPNAAGDNNGWATAVGGTAGAANNYTRVSERPPDDATSYNQTTATGTTTIDDFNVEDRATAGIGASDTISLVQVGGRVASDNTTAASIVYRLKGQSSGTVQESASVTVANTSWSVHAGQSPRPYQLTAYVNPQGSAAWTPSALDGIQVGVRGDVSQTTVRRVSTLWALVEFQPLTSAALTLASETDTGQALAKTKTRALGVASETGTARDPARSKTKALTLGAETGTAQTLGRRKALVLGAATETGTARLLTGVRQIALTAATETAAAQAQGKAKQRALGTAAETETTLTLARASGLQLTEETTAARPLPQIKTRALSRTGESATSLPLGGGKARAVVPVEEAWTAHPLGGAKARTVGVAGEVASALLLAGAKTGPLSTAEAVETARSLTGSQAAALTPASEAGTAQPFARGKQRPLGVAVETATVRATGAAKTAPLAPAASVDQAQRLTMPGRIVPAEETGPAQPLGAAKKKTLTAAAETGAGLALSRRKQLLLGPSAATETALGPGRAKTSGLVMAAGSDTARPVGAVKLTALGPAAETSRALIGPKIRLTQAIDRAEAVPLVGHHQQPAEHLDAYVSRPVLTSGTSGPDLTTSSSGPRLAASVTGGG
ncbi:hypothetical protein ACH3XX_09725 [Streptomyces scabiei]|uniref:hypothetical protein n=1 Tax=Streptomyces scabiei TaxID=1930 RepID=UPI0037A96073